jgi:hypothetical protein
MLRVSRLTGVGEGWAIGVEGYTGEGCNPAELAVWA